MNYYGARELAESFRTVRKNTLQVADDIPEDKYSFKAAPDTMSIAEMLAHLACSTQWAAQIHFVNKNASVTVDDFRALIGEASKQAVMLTTKGAIVDALKTRGEDFARKLENMSDAQLAERVGLPNGSKSRFEMLLGVKEHEMHHRAQLFQMERMVGIVPHLTRERQQRTGATAARS
jgi:uncharacterized damage-inducible protein DinB